MKMQRRFWAFILTGIVCAAVLSILVWDWWLAPERADLDGQVPFDLVYHDAVLSLDAYDLTDQQLKSKYADKDVVAGELPASRTRYFLMVDKVAQTQTISVRGTSNLRNVFVDAQYGKVRDPKLDVYLHRGFQEAAAELLADVLPRLEKKYATILTGHSLGGAVAAIVAMQLREQGFKVERTITFGQPKVTNAAGATAFADAPLLRIINLDDVVATVPPSSLIGSVDAPYRHFAPEVVLLKDKKYLHRLPVVTAEQQELLQQAQEEQESERGLWEDRFDAHRIVNYCARIEEVLDGGQHVRTEDVSMSTASLAPTTADARKLALLVGIDEYQNVPHLNGCVRDVHAVKNLLIGSFGFVPRNVRVLTNAGAARIEIIKVAKQHLLGRATSDSVVVFHFSGHGSQMKDVDGDEADGFDETLAAYDSRSPGVYDIPDDELNKLFSQLADKAASFTALLDCCHSGTGLRDPGVRRVPPDEREPPAESVGNTATRGTDPAHFADAENYTLIAACRAGEQAHEYNHLGQFNGALTYFLTQEASRGRAHVLTYRDVMDSVRVRINTIFPHQHPQLEGSQQDFVLFGTPRLASLPYISVSPKPDRSIVLLAGQAQGMTEGSTFDVYPPATKAFAASDTPLARVKLTEVRAFASDAEIVRDETLPEAEQKWIPVGARAVERTHAWGTFRFPVHVVGGDADMQQLSDRLAPHEHIVIAETPEGAVLTIQMQPRAVEISSATGMMDARTIDRTNGEWLAQAEQQLLHMARWYNLLQLDNPHSDLRIDLQVGEGDATSPFREGENVRVAVHNPNEQRDVYFVILDLESTGGVSVLYPRSGQSMQLAARNSRTIRPRFTVPKGKTEIRDFLKVIATVEPIDVRCLEMEPLRGLRAANPLEGLLNAAAAGSRKAEVIDVENDSWSTSMVECRVLAREHE